MIQGVDVCTNEWYELIQVKVWTFRDYILLQHT